MTGGELFSECGGLAPASARENRLEIEIVDTNIFVSQAPIAISNLILVLL